MSYLFTEGNIVKLQSGGPEMTVENPDNIGPDGHFGWCKCVWFEGTTLRINMFKTTTLIDVKK